MDRIKPSKLMQRIGIGAGALLLLLLAIALTPPLIVRYRLHAFTSRLHAGMSAARLQEAALRVHLPARSLDAGQVEFPIDEPWTFGSCSSDYVVVVSLKDARVTKWAQIRESLCTKQ